MLKCWQYKPLKRPSFKEIRVYLNIQIQQLSKTIDSTISSISSSASHNDLKLLSNNAQKDQQSTFIKKNYSDEADDEETTGGEVFVNNNNTSLNDDPYNYVINDSQIDKNRLTNSNSTPKISKKQEITSLSCELLNVTQQNRHHSEHLTDSNYESGSSSYYSPSIENTKSPNEIDSNGEKQVLVYFDKNNDKCRNKVVEKVFKYPPSPLIQNDIQIEVNEK
jgi:hypothetical protein